MFPLRQQAAITGLERVLQRSRLDPTTVDEERYMLSAVLGQCPVANIAMQGKGMLTRSIYNHRSKQFCQGQVVELSQRTGNIAAAGRLQGNVFFKREVETHRRVACCITL